MEADRPSVSEEQLVYARGLGIGVKLALAALVGSFVSFLAGWFPAAVPLERLPQLWSLPARQYLERTGIPHGWGWVTSGTAETWLLGSIAFLLSVSTLCLLLLLPLQVRRRDWPYVAITLAQIAVVALAASSAFTVIR